MGLFGLWVAAGTIHHALTGTVPHAEVMGGIPALLLGLEDPPCNAHGENESLDLGDFHAAARASAHLFAELAEALSR